MLDALPARARPAAARFLALQAQVFAGWLRLPRLPSPTRHIHPRCGDVLLCPGAGWADLRHAALVEGARRRHGMRFALLVHDLIPLRRPEWVHPAHAARFRTWLNGVLPQADVLLAPSAATARDVAAYAAAAGVTALPRPLTFGCGFGHGAEGARGRLPAPGSYALFVSTIEPRKNHTLLLSVWRRLGELLPPGRRPTLVFAGRAGSGSADLLAQLRPGSSLEGCVAFLPEVSDAELAALYRGCLFTLFPSLFEGWGLPVSESLAFGKPCFAAAATSLPEAGGRLARYFDPDSAPDAARVIAEVLADPDSLRAWEARIRAEFHAVSWTDTARAVLACLDG